MGSYTDIGYEEIEVLDYEGLKETIKILRKNGNIYVHESVLELNDKEKTISFQGWDGYKIISYWYENMVLVLDLISPYIRGDIYLRFETSDESGRIEFTDGDCIIHTGNMIWSKNKADKFYRETLKLSSEIKKLKSKLNLVRTANKI